MGCSSLSGSGKAAIVVFLVYFCEDLFGMNIQKHHERPWSAGVSTTLLRTHLAGPWKQGLPMLALCAAQRRSEVGIPSNRYGMIDHAWWKGSKGTTAPGFLVHRWFRGSLQVFCPLGRGFLALFPLTFLFAGRNGNDPMHIHVTLRQCDPATTYVIHRKYCCSGLEVRLTNGSWCLDSHFSIYFYFLIYCHYLSAVGMISDGSFG